MKRSLVGMGMLSLALMMAPSTVLAVAPGGPNCGWGNLLFRGQSGLPSHLVAVTTNGSTGNATFGMTSGTNGCSVDGKLTYGGKDMVDVSSIMDEFSEDVARGNGEALDTVAVMFGVQPQDRSVFAEVMHDHFAVIFPDENVTARQVLVSVNSVMRNDARLAKYAA